MRELYQERYGSLSALEAERHSRPPSTGPLEPVTPAQARANLIALAKAVEGVPLCLDCVRDGRAHRDRTHHYTSTGSLKESA